MRQRKRSIFVIHNPVAGWRRKRFLDAVLAGLDDAGCTVGLRATEARGDAETIAATARLDGYDVIAVAGGDGTINEVANGLMKREQGVVPTLAIIPTGTANILAHEIGLTARPEPTVAYLVAGGARAVRLGTVNGRVFVCMASAGFDSWVVDHVNLRAKRLLGKGAYGLATIGGLLAWHPARLEVEADGQRFTAATVSVQKAQRYGGAFVMAPEASLTLPTVELCMVRDGGRAALVRCGADLALGRAAASPVIERVRARRVTISGVGALQADGDVVGRLPAVVEADAMHLKLLYPRNFS